LVRIVAAAAIEHAETIRTNKGYYRGALLALGNVICRTDPAALVKQCLARGNVMEGMRRREEWLAASRLFDAAFWIERPGAERGDTDGVDCDAWMRESDAAWIVPNDGDKEILRTRLRDVLEGMGYLPESAVAPERRIDVWYVSGRYRHPELTAERSSFEEETEVDREARLGAYIMNLGMAAILPLNMTVPCATFAHIEAEEYIRLDVLLLISLTAGRAGIVMRPGWRAHGTMAESEGARAEYEAAKAAGMVVLDGDKLGADGLERALTAYGKAKSV